VLGEIAVPSGGLWMLVGVEVRYSLLSGAFTLRTHLNL